MKKLLIIFALILPFISCQKEEPEMYMVPENLLLGFSFEDSFDDFWNSGTFGEFDFGLSITEYYDGKACLEMSCETTTNDNFGFWAYRYYEPERGAYIKVKMRVKAVDLVGEGFAFSMYGRDLTAGTTPIGFYSEAIDIDNEEWNTYEFEMPETVSENVDLIDFYFIMLGNTSGMIYLDKVEILD